MLRVTAELNGNEETFRTNNNGFALFCGISENKQLDCESGYQNLSRMKRRVSQIMHSRYGSGRVKFIETHGYNI